MKNDTKQKGERKEGRQDHIQIIMSRKDITNTIKLSPQDTSKGKNKEHSAELSEFNRTAAFKKYMKRVLNNSIISQGGPKVSCVICHFAQ